MTIPSGFRTQYRFSKYTQITDIFADVSFTTTGAAVALTSTKNWGVSAVTQVVASSPLYLLALDQTYPRLLGISFSPQLLVTAGAGAAPVNECLVRVADGVGGGVAVVSFASAHNGDYVMLQFPPEQCAPYVATGVTSDAFTGTGAPMTLTIAAGAFTPDMVGARISISGAATAGNNGTYGILTVPGATSCTYTNASGKAEVFAGTATVVQQNVKIAALTNTQVAVDGQFVLGTGGTINADTCTAFSNCINQLADAGTTTMGCSVLPNTITAVASGGATDATKSVVIKSTKPGVKIYSSNATRIPVVTDTVNTVSVGRVMPPGVVLASVVASTNILTPFSSGDECKITLTLQASDT